MDKKSSINLIFALILGISFPMIILISAIEAASFDKAFFMAQVKENHVVKNTGIHQEDMRMVIDEINAFLRGTRENFDIQARLAEEKPVSIFNEQERVHMNDVRELLNKGLAFRNWGIVLFLLSFCFLLKSKPKGIFQGLFYGSLIFLLMIVFTGACFFFNFDGAFTLFHQLFFSNDLWIMNPQTDRLIWIVPSPFFFQLIIRILVYTLILLFITCVTSAVILKINDKNRGKNENIKY